MGRGNARILWCPSYQSMLVMSVSNPRFPHKCIVYRETCSPFNDDVERTYLYGSEEEWCECRKESSTSKRTFKTDNVIRSDYRLSLPGQVKGIHGGDLIDVTDLQGTYERCEVTDTFATNLGTSVFFNYPKN